MRVIRSMIIAFSTYSRIPMPQVEWSDANKKYTMCFFPAIGAVVGLLTGVVSRRVFAALRAGGFSK